MKRYNLGSGVQPQDDSGRKINHPQDDAIAALQQANANLGSRYATDEELAESQRLQNETIAETYATKADYVANEYVF